MLHIIITRGECEITKERIPSKIFPDLFGSAMEQWTGL